MFEVKKINDRTFEVTVQGKVTTQHQVTMEPSYYEKLTSGKVSPETLVEKSFEFLLEREPNTSILKHFDLPLINHYFPEYESKIKEKLG
jgi:hypothetical protein